MSSSSSSTSSIPNLSHSSSSSAVVTQSGDYVLLHFGDGKQIFAQCLPGKQGGVKISKRTYDTGNLIGLPYGTVLELHRGKGLIPTTNPDFDDHIDTDHPWDDTDGGGEDPQEDIERSSPGLDGCTRTVESFVLETKRDNRHLVDTNTSQRLSHHDLQQMRCDTQWSGRDIVHAIIQNSTTFAKKTDFSKAKYIQKKLQKYQPQCRILPCSPINICQALYSKDARKISNLRCDTLAQILSYANVSAGSKVMIFDTPGTLGIVTGSVAKKLSGYGIILAIYDKAQPTCCEILDRFNLSFAEQSSIHWLHTGEIFTPRNVNIDDNHVNNLNDNNKNSEDKVDYERLEREAITWPCPLQSHTRTWLQTMSTDQQRIQFLDKRCSRFARKLTRPTVMEVSYMAKDPYRPCDCLILATTYDPTSTLLTLLPYLGPSCPFVVYYPYLEPLLTCFHTIQELGLAIQLRLCDSWLREYQILPGRTHPFMKMSQNGGFLFMGIKAEISISTSCCESSCHTNHQDNHIAPLKLDEQQQHQHRIVNGKIHTGNVPSKNHIQHMGMDEEEEMLVGELDNPRKRQKRSTQTHTESL